MTRQTTCFLALEPERAFAVRVLAYKKRTAELAGPQLYLEDPPHLTLYVGAFPEGADVAAASAAVASNLPAPATAITGWHVFDNDQLTGNQTLVCQIDPQQRQGLRNWQQRIAAAVSPLRDADACRSRYAPCWHRLAQLEQDNVEQWGFPFLGTIWHPHLTIASVRASDWATVWPTLAAEPPAGTVCFPSLNLYALDAGQPVLLERFRLETSP